MTSSKSPWILGILLLTSLAGADLAAQPVLTFIEQHFDNVGGVDGLDGALDLAFSPDGDNLYVGAQNDAAVAAFVRNPETGELTFVDAYFEGVDGIDGLDGLQGLDVSPDGKHVYTASIDNPAVSVFARAPATGSLSFVEAETDFGSMFLSQLKDVVVSGDGDFVYATVFQGRVLVYARDQATGALTFSSSYGSDMSPFDPLVGANELRLSPDGKNLYVAASLDDTVSVFDVDPVTGALTMVQLHTDGVSGVDGLDDAGGLLFGPRGDVLYVSGSEDRAIAIFDRDPVDGLLSFRSMVSNGTGGVEGLWGVLRMALSPSGRFLYAGSRFEGRIHLFERAPDGSLTQAQTIAAGGINGVASSPDGAHAYFSSFSVLSAYLAPPAAVAAIFADGFESGNTTSWSLSVP